VVSQREKHDPFCRYRHDDSLARHDCGPCDLIARVRADERVLAVGRLDDAWRQSYNNGQGRLNRLGAIAAVCADEQAKP
jgi:hypothetical protein